MYVKPLIPLSFKEYNKPLMETLRMLFIPSAFVVVYLLFATRIPHMLNFAFGGMIFTFSLFLVIKKLFPYIFVEIKSLLIKNIK
jgi:hypothetical protein